jgi:hypothetical protein
MRHVKAIEIDIEQISDLVLIASDDSVWLVVATRWWDLASLIWWWLCPADKRARVNLRMGAGIFVSAKAVRVATRHARVHGKLK